MKRIAVLLSLLFLTAYIPLAPATASAFELGLEPVSGKVGASIKIPAFCQYGHGDYYLYWDETQVIQQGTVDVKGCSPIYFTVPQTYRGRHTVTLKLGGKSWSRDFTVTGGISLDIKMAAAGTSVNLQGSGFEQNEAKIYITYDGVKVAQNIEANSNGTWTYQLKIPVSSSGSHTISAAGPATSLAEVGSLQFEVTPSISVNPSSGWVGRVVNISGRGFGSGESGIAVVYDNATVKSALSADSLGSWQSSFSVPPSSRGTHRVDAFGSMSPAEKVPDVTFTVAPGIHVEQAGRKLGEVIHVDDVLIISGIGFKANESRIIVTYDNLPIIENIVADAQGSWSAQLELPATSYGDHVIGASGDATRADEVTPTTIFVTPDLTINPDSGAIGDHMVLIGHGFSSNQPLTLYYDMQKITTSASTDFKGNLNFSFTPPPSSGGVHTLRVTDGGGASASVTLTIESIPPQTPVLLSPEDGKTYGLLDSSPVIFTWSAVEDPSGVVYTLQIGQNEDFSGSVTTKERLEKTEYRLGVSERPLTGRLYWKVKAADLAGNTSGWSKIRSIEFTGSNLVWPVVISLAVLVIIILVIWRIRVISKKGGWKSDSDSDS